MSAKTCVGLQILIKSSKFALAVADSNAPVPPLNFL